MNCKIKWNALELKDWDARFARIRRSNLLQGYDYARAVCPIYRQNARWGLIEIDGIEAGLVQILEAGLFKNLIHAVVIDRAPLWFDGFGSLDHFDAFTAELANEFPKRIGRKRRFIPEIKDCTEVRSILKRHGFKLARDKDYATIWIDLTKSEDQLWQSLNPKRRNKVRKAKKSGLTVKWEDGAQSLPWLLKYYALDQKQKNYEGASEVVIKALVQTHMGNAQAGKRMLIGKAMVNGKAIAAILIFKHGISATYQIGWTSGEGRKYAAHPLLLWQAFLRLKAQGIQDFDLGGINDEEASGVTKFKLEMGGERTTLSGLYI